MTATTTPRALNAIARLFVISGAISLIHSTFWIMRGRFILDFGLIAFWVGFGLLSRKKIYWIFARALLAAMLVLLSGITTIMLYVSITTMRRSSLATPLVAIFLMLLLLLTFWQYRAIISPDVRKVFEPRLKISI